MVAKAPEAGKAKTRLCPPATDKQAALIAAASLLDTLRAVTRTPGTTPVVAWTGSFAPAQRLPEISTALEGMTLLPQRGETFGQRLAAAHRDTAELRLGCPVLQIGMDTPQITPELLAASAAPLHGDGGPDVVLGPATDGGWWALGLRDPRWAALLADVPMSVPDTGARTEEALREHGLRVRLLPQLCDVDTMAAAEEVAELIPESEFAAALRAAKVG